VERFLDVDRWAAADLVARLMKARLEQFEHILGHGLPALTAGLARPARAVLERQAEQLKDWMTGILAWHRRSPRYTDAELRRAHHGFTQFPTGLGTSAARIGVPCPRG
jgi:germacradienol/geosmin synthase